jgi:predicted acyltransferase
MAFKEVPFPPPREPRPTSPTPAAKPAAAAPPVPPAKPETRLVSLDAYRGFIMLLMASAGFGVATLVGAGKLAEAGIEAGSFADRFWRFWAWQLEHVPWQGGVLWDMIQPAFMFMVGVALPYSYARRAQRGESYFKRFVHMLGRSLLVVLLAVYLSTRSGAPRTNFVFTNVLAQIGLGYPLLFLFVNKPRWLQLAAVVLIAGGWWYAFYQHPLPPPDFDYRTVGLKEKQWTEQKADFVPEGIKQHWAYNTNFAAVADRTILNWFPRQDDSPRKIKREGDPPRNVEETDEEYEARLAANPQRHVFLHHDGGYTTLNFVPSLITMLLGLVVGEMLRAAGTHGDKLKRLAILAVTCLVAGLAAHYTVCPIVKRIWTPSWALASGAAVIGMLMLFYVVIDVGGWKRLGWPLAVVGMNSIVVYLMSQMLKGPTARLVKTHLGTTYNSFAEWASARTGSAWNPEMFGGPFGPIYEHLAILLCFWLVCFWLWKQKLFVRL